MDIPKPSEDDKQFFLGLMPGDPAVEVKPMFGNLGAFVHGNMFAGLFGPAVGVRLDETGLPTRYYLPREDVRTDLLRPTDTATHCPYKGDASYWSAQVGGETYEDVVWSYETPIPQAEGITGLMCFYPERVELTVSGERQPSSQAAAR